MPRVPRSLGHGGASFRAGELDSERRCQVTIIELKRPCPFCGQKVWLNDSGFSVVLEHPGTPPRGNVFCRLVILAVDRGSTASIEKMRIDWEGGAK